MSPDERKEYVTLARENARTRHTLGMEHAHSICETCEREAKAGANANRLAMLAQLVQARSENKQLLARQIEKLGGTVTLALVFPMGEPKANARLKQAAVYVAPTAPPGAESVA